MSSAKPCKTMLLQLEVAAVEGAILEPTAAEEYRLVRLQWDGLQRGRYCRCTAVVGLLNSC